MAECKQCAVAVRNVRFGYKRKTENNLVLNSVNISAKKGDVYGLMGPSGCGKTTLIKIIIGLLQIKIGEVSVFGYKPGTRESGTPGIGVGYMPQEISLPMLLTINEVFEYFGRIYLLDNEFIVAQMKYFLNAFGLTDANERISTLSGGQKRRVSLAIALFSFPRLLILDEPTVGVDPLLRQRIWSLLTKLVKERNTTIIVSTHYIEEMRNAETVAFMRNGEILTEGNPGEIIRASNGRTLEEAFLKHCVDNKKHKKANKPSGSVPLRTPDNKHFVDKLVNTNEKEPLKTERFKNIFSQNMNILKAINWKILRTYFRHGGPPFAFSLPILAAVLLIMTVGTYPENVRLGLVVDDESLVFHHNETIEEGTFLPDLLLNCIEKSNVFTIVKYNTTNEAKDDAKKLKIVGYIHLKKNFSEAFIERDLFLNSGTDDVSNYTIDAGSVHLSMDLTIKPLFELFRNGMLDIIRHFREDAYEAIGVNCNMSLYPLQMGDAIHATPGRKNYNLHTHNTVVAMFVCAYFGFSVAATAIPLLLDINDETFSRLFSAGVKPYHLLFVELFTQFFIMSFSALLTFSLLIFVFNVPCRGSHLFALTNVLLAILSGLSLGALLAVTIRTPFNCHIFIYAIFTESVQISDAMWPSVTAPYFMKLILPFTPLYFQTTTSLKIFNYPYCDFITEVLPAFASSIFYALFSAIVSCVMLQRVY